MERSTMRRRDGLIVCVVLLCSANANANAALLTRLCAALIPSSPRRGNSRATVQRRPTQDLFHFRLPLLTRRSIQVNPTTDWDQWPQVWPRLHTFERWIHVQNKAKQSALGPVNGGHSQRVWNGANNSFAPSNHHT